MTGGHQMATRATEHARREQAFRDYCNLEAEGISPNPNALYDYYISMNRSNPELRSRIPTTNRTTVYEWAKEDKWKERYAEIKLTQADVLAEKYESVRDRSYAKLVSFQNEALDALLDLTQNSTDKKVRLAAAESILDRTGLARIPHQRPRASDAAEKVDAAADEGLPENATDQQITEWLVRNSDSTMNA
jgi:hypothetical protein